jgi:outer membrane lipoprotein LolB
MMRFLVLAWLGILSGCAALSPDKASAPIVRPAHAGAAAFAFNGRVATNHQDERHSAGLRWTHQAQSDEILLLTPLGQTAARIYRDAKNATLDDSNKHYEADDAESLMQQVLGWHLPMDGLHHWVLGLAAADSPAYIKRDGNGQIIALHQSGWEVRYMRYAGTEPDSLPTRLQLNRGDLQIQLLIDEWELP